MKKLLLLVAITLLFINGGAQVQFGIKAGANLANIHLSPTIPYASSNLQPGFDAGVFLNVPLFEHLGLQNELIYSAQGAKFNTNFEKFTERLRYLSVPVLLKYDLSSSFFAVIGPQASFLLSARKKVHYADYIPENPGDPLIDQTGDNVDIKSYFKSVDLSGVIGLGYHFTRDIGAAMVYKHSILNILTSTDASARQSVFQIDLFYLFKK